MFASPRGICVNNADALSPFPSFEVKALQPHALDDALIAKEKMMFKVFILASASDSKCDATSTLSRHQVVSDFDRW